MTRLADVDRELHGADIMEEFKLPGAKLPAHGQAAIFLAVLTELTRDEFLSTPPFGFFIRLGSSEDKMTTLSLSGEDICSPASSSAA